jgi:hypothetical protein
MHSGLRLRSRVYFAMVSIRSETLRGQYIDLQGNLAAAAGLAWIKLARQSRRALRAEDRTAESAVVLAA